MSRFDLTHGVKSVTLASKDGWRWMARSYIPVRFGYVSENAEYPSGWKSHGYALTRRGALRKAKRGLEERQGFLPADLHTPGAWRVK